MKNLKDSKTAQYTLVFDSECRLCSRTARLLQQHDRRRRLQWVPAQSEVGEAVIRARGIRAADMESILLVGPGEVRHTNGVKIHPTWNSLKLAVDGLKTSIVSGVK